MSGSAADVPYIARVRELLKPDLSVEDLDTLASDFEEQISALDPGDVEATLGSPESFVESFRTSAGLEGHIRERRLGLHLIHRWLEDILGWLDDRRVSPLGQLWSQYQPAWWLIRGWLPLVMFAVAYTPSSSVFRPFPVPNVNELATTSFALLALLTTTSVLLSRMSSRPLGRLANVGVSAFATYAFLVAMVNS